MSNKYHKLFDDPSNAQYIIPVPLYTSFMNSKNHVELHVPKFRSQWAQKFFFWIKKQTYHIELDDLGSIVYRQCDGTKTISEIVALVQAQSSEIIEQLEERTFEFFRQMYEFGYIQVKIKETT